MIPELFTTPFANEIPTQIDFICLIHLISIHLLLRHNLSDPIPVTRSLNSSFVYERIKSENF